MGYDPNRLMNLGLAAFMENVGMYQIPDNIVNKKGSLDQSEMRVIRQHPEKSYHMLSQMGKKYLWLAELSLQTHERANGSGYPKGLKGEQISELASIVGLADTYVALASDRPYRKRCLQSDAVKWIVTEGKALFPTNILKALLNEISFFPVGTHVRLNNRCIGQVLSTEKNQPLRPHIRILYDGRGNEVENGLAIRLVEEPLLYIKEALLMREEDRLRV
jgi:HD-GYP domain-containing protein (c-di-GMP phosphodiesterase class II)